MTYRIPYLLDLLDPVPYLSRRCDRIPHLSHNIHAREMGTACNLHSITLSYKLRLLRSSDQIPPPAPAAEKHAFVGIANSYLGK